MFTLPRCGADVDGPTHTLGRIAGGELVDPEIEKNQVV